MTKRHWTKSIEMIKKAIKEDDFPISLLALELSRVENLPWKDAKIKAQELINSVDKK